MNSLHRFVAVGLLTIAASCRATLLPANLIEFEGAVSGVNATGSSRLSLLQNGNPREIRRLAGCNAIGQVRGRWRIVEGKLWLAGVVECADNIELQATFGGNGNPIFADWITANLITERGKWLCEPRHGLPGVQEVKIVFEVERGVVRNVIRVSNQNHPAIPTVEGLRKLLGPKYAHQAKELISDWPCFEEAEVDYLRSNASVEGPNGISFDEYTRGLSDPGRRLRTH